MPEGSEVRLAGRLAPRPLQMFPAGEVELFRRTVAATSHTCRRLSGGKDCEPYLFLLVFFLAGAFFFFGAAARLGAAFLRCLAGFADALAGATFPLVLAA
jgi:hypothetical protein